MNTVQYITPLHEQASAQPDDSLVGGSDVLPEAQEVEGRLLGTAGSSLSATFVACSFGRLIVTAPAEGGVLGKEGAGSVQLYVGFAGLWCLSWRLYLVPVPVKLLVR